MPAHWTPLGQAAEELAAARELTVEEGRLALLTALAEGHRQSEALRPGEIHYQPLAAAFWRLVFREADIDFEENRVRAGSNRRFSYNGVRVSPEGEALEGHPAAAHESPRTLKTATDRRGRPPEYDWKKIGILSAVVVHAQGVPSGRGRITEFRVRLEQAMTDQNWQDQDIPGKTELEKYASDLIHALDEA